MRWKIGVVKKIEKEKNVDFFSSLNQFSHHP
jgi:hypothetical protein